MFISKHFQYMNNLKDNKIFEYLYFSIQCKVYHFQRFKTCFIFFIVLYKFISGGRGKKLLFSKVHPLLISSCSFGPDLLLPSHIASLFFLLICRPEIRWNRVSRSISLSKAFLSFIKVVRSSAKASALTSSSSSCFRILIPHIFLSVLIWDSNISITRIN